MTFDRRARCPGPSLRVLLLGLVLGVSACPAAPDETSEPRSAPPQTTPTAERAESRRSGEEPFSGALADVVSVRASGTPGAYRFDVGVRSPDTGCRQYADWWEVVGPDGRLIYRRVLAHSHVGEQPFVRGGEPVPVGADSVVWVRAHLHPVGYGGQAFLGSARDGFRAADLPPSFAAQLATEPPRPPDCAR